MNRCFLFLTPLFLFFGCSDSSRPTDLPPLYPCTVTVTQGGVALADAYVELVPQDGQKYTPGATTDANGNAVMLTYGFPGAPAGKYKITVSKTIEDDFVTGTNDYGEQVTVPTNAYRLVDDRYFRADTTLHEIEVTTQKKQSTTIDVGEAVRVKLQQY